MKLFIYSIQLTLLFMVTSSYALEVAPFEKALSLAQFERYGKKHTLLVLSDNGSVVTGIDISAKTGAYPEDRFDLVNQLGYKTLHQFSSIDLPRLSLHHKELLPLSRISKHHIGVGINYPEHGKETGQKTQPFLFPKIIQSTGSRETITMQPDQLLDYEVELCARFDQDIKKLEDMKTALVGFFLCGDFTDRAQLMRLIDTSNTQSGIGFTDAKSKMGYYPTGPYLVVPRNWRDFLKEIRLQLSVNNEIKQNSYASEMILSVNELIVKALETGAESKWLHQDNKVPILPSKFIRKGAAILTGTPEGVIFRPPSSGYKFRKIVKYIFTGKFIKMGAKQYVIEQYIEDKLNEKSYLQPGDLVNLNAPYLGNILVEISFNRG